MQWRRDILITDPGGEMVYRLHFNSKPRGIGIRGYKRIGCYAYDEVLGGYHEVWNIENMQCDRYYTCTDQRWKLREGIY